MAPSNHRRLSLLVTCQSSIVAAPEHIDAAVGRTYAPLLDALADPGAPRLALHVGGYLLDRLARAHEGLLLRLKEYVEAGRVELVGGLFYGGPPALLPESDVRGQLAMLREFWESFVGAQPRGVYLPEGAWAAELPRLLEDTGVDYAYAWAAQLQPQAFLGRVERGGLSLLTLGLHPLRPDGSDVGTATQALLGALPPHEGAALHVAAESLGEGAAVAENLRALGQALEAHGTITLPREVLALPPPVVPVRVVQPYAPVGAAPPAAAPLVTDWAEFPARFAEAQVAYRCMLRASGRLSRAIAQMEDEGLDERWSDALATAQRLIFAAQGAEVLGVGHTAGVLDPAVRDAALARLIDAERLLDQLVHDERAFFEVDESDVDGDLRPDVWLHGRAATAWLQPARGGAVRALEHRAWRRNVLDAGTRRLLPGAAVGEGTFDVTERQGLRCALYPEATPWPVAVAGGASDLLAELRGEEGEAWQIVSESPAPPRPGTVEAAQTPPIPYALELRATPDLGPHGRWTFEHAMHLPADAFGLRWSGRWSCKPGAQENCLWALEVPLRLGSGPLRLLSGGATLSAGSHPLPSNGMLHVAGEAGTLALTVKARRDGAPLAVNVWWTPLLADVVDASLGATAGAWQLAVGGALWLSCPALQGGEVELNITGA